MGSLFAHRKERASTMLFAFGTPNMSAAARGPLSGSSPSDGPTSKVISVAEPCRQIVVVEDDPSLLFIATKRLRAAGFEPLPAANGKEAIERIAENPSCRRMVTDFYMPGLGGDDWIRYLEREHADWTIVVMSSEDIDSGPFIVLPKPVDFENLLEVFHRETMP
jgi:CheY-like chemotaxis protein